MLRGDVVRLTLQHRLRHLHRWCGLLPREQSLPQRERELRIVRSIKVRAVIGKYRGRRPTQHRRCSSEQAEGHRLIDFHLQHLISHGHGPGWVAAQLSARPPQLATMQEANKNIRPSPVVG